MTVSSPLRTPRLLLVPATAAHVAAELAGRDAFGALLGADVPASWPPGEYDESAQHHFLDSLHRAGAAGIGWYGWYALLCTEPGRTPPVIACGGYFGPPGADGVVELGFSVCPEWRARGVASEMVAALAAHAAGQPGVTRVVAHTTPANAASVRVLTRSGFVPSAGGADPDVLGFALASTRPTLPTCEAGDPRRLPDGVARVAESLVASAGAQAVVLAGSRASPDADPQSDWDLTVYYRGSVDLAPLSAHGPVHPPGAWGRLMNGGAWLTVEGLSVDVMLRDLAVVEHWADEARRGSYELDAILGYLAGLPTYVLMAELASGRVLAGGLPMVASMPPALVEEAPPRWRFARDFSLEYARMHAARGNAIGAVGQAAKAVVEEAHARLCARGQWVLNEKRMVRDAGLDAVQSHFAVAPSAGRDVASWLDEIRDGLHV